MDRTILEEWFNRVDSAHTGNVTASQLKSALAVGNLDLPLSVVEQMIRMYDYDRNGTMNFEEFVALNQFLLKVQQAFSDLERDRGFLDHDDVYKALVKLGFSLDTPAFYTACERFDENKNGKFQLDNFISLSIFLQSARNLFNSFDTNKQGRVTLDLNQFIYCRDNIMDKTIPSRYVVHFIRSENSVSDIILRSKDNLVSVKVYLSIPQSRGFNSHRSNLETISLSYKHNAANCRI